MPLFTAIGAALFGAGTFLAGATAFVLQAAAGIGLNLIAAAIKGKPTQEKVGIQGKLSAGGDVPRSIILGKYNTAGSLVYRNTWGQDGDTPNANYVEVRALADFPVGSFPETWVDGEKVTLVAGDRGYTSQQHIKHDSKWGDIESLWFRFYDGTQTTADSYLVGALAGSDRPWGPDRIGKGVPYVIIIARRDDTQTDNPIFNGFPQCKFTVQGAKLYDPSRDSSVGGSGSQRYSDPSTWGGDGDDLPVVQIYNILRGITYGGKWLYGLQASSPAILPVANWIAAINKCRATVDGPDGSEAQYRSGIQIDVNVAPADAIEALLKTCNGRLTEVGGVYTIHVGEPDTPVLSFSDADILSTEEQVYNPFRALADSINGVVAKYPEPLEGWNVKTSPQTKNPAQIARDGSRELFADVDLSACPYTGQVQRLLKSAMLEALRERRHTIVLPPWAQVLEPGDIVSLTSDRNGYDDKWFRIDGMAYKANLDVMLQITEVDPSDYDWDQDEDYVPPVFAPMEILRPAPQPIIAWYAEGQIVSDASGLPRRPVIYLSWDGNKEDVSAVAYEIAKTASDDTVILRGRTDDARVGSIIVSSQAFVPGETYYARGRYVPTSPRATEFSDWLPAILPNLNFGIIDFDASVQKQVTEVFQAALDDTNKRISRIAAVVQQAMGRLPLDKIEIRQDQVSLYENNKAFIEHVQTTAADADAAMAQDIVTISASVDDAKAEIETNQTAIATTQEAVATLENTVGAEFDGVKATVQQHTTAIATLDGYAAASWGVAVDINGSVVGYIRIDGDASSSTFTVNANNFLVTFPGSTGGAPIPVWAISNVNGVAKIVWRGDMVGDGSLLARMIGAGQVNAVHIEAFSINTQKLAINSVGIEQIIANAVSNTKFFAFSSPGTVFTSAVVGATPVTITSQTVNIQSGAATVRIAAGWNQTPIGSFAGNDPGPVTCGFALVVDGVFRRGFFFPMQLNKGYTQAQLCASFTEEYTVTGLSAGNHSFVFRSLHNGTSGPNEWGLSAVPFGAVMTDGQMSVTDFRR